MGSGMVGGVAARHKTAQKAVQRNVTFRNARRKIFDAFVIVIDMIVIALGAVSCCYKTS